MLCYRFGSLKNGIVRNGAMKNPSSKRFYSNGNIPSTAQVLRYETTGAPETVLKLETQNLPNKLNDNQVLVKILAAPVNPADLNMIEGSYGIRPTLPAVGGNEGVGVVVATGSSVKNLSVNDRVIPARAGLGTWRTFGVFESKDFLKIPKDINDEYAATISVNPATALRLLEDFVPLKEGDVVLQNGANSMVGTAFMQLAHSRGIKTINIIRNRPDFPAVVEKLKALGGTMVVTEDYAKTPPFKRIIADMPKPKLALNLVGGESATELARLLGEGGTMVTYGGMSRKPVTIPTSLFIFKNIQLKGFWLTKWAETHSLEERSKMYETLFEMIRKDKLRLWMEQWPLTKYAQAFEKIKQPQRDRKTIFTMH